MFRHTKRLQYYSKPTGHDADLAKRVQELIGGSYGEMTVMMQYLFQGWTAKGPAKYRDMLLDIGTEEIGHVEMLATLITHLLEKAPTDVKDAAAKDMPIVGAIMGGQNGKDALMAHMSMMPAHQIVSGEGAMPVNSAGYPWNGNYVTASGNLLADFRANLSAESQGRLQACRVYNMTDDRGVKDTLAFMIERDYEHQLHWMATIEELERSGEERGTVVPVEFGHFADKTQHAYEFWGLSDGEAAKDGYWANGIALDGSGKTYEYLDQPEPLGPIPEYAPPDPRLFATMPAPKTGTGSTSGSSMTGVQDSDHKK